MSRSGLRSLGVAQGDLDKDGVPDLILAYTGEREGALILLRGNEDSIFPGQARAQGRLPGRDGRYAPFFPGAVRVNLPAPIDSLTAADVNQDGNMDAVAMARGGEKLFVLAGDGRGVLAPPRAVALPGTATAWTAGEYGRPDGRSEIVVAVQGPRGPRLLEYSGLDGESPAAAEEHPLPARAKGLKLGRLASDVLQDLALDIDGDVFLMAGHESVRGIPTPDRELRRAPEDTMSPASMPVHPGADPANLPPEVRRLAGPAPIAVLPMRLNEDAVDDWVVMSQDSVLLAVSAPLATYTVNSANDVNDGACNLSHCSLREAILAANASPGADQISFNIGRGAVTIAPVTDLPTITDTVTIDATTQSGFTGTPIVELRGHAAGYGFRLEAYQCVIRGFVINNWSIGIFSVTKGGSTFEGNYVGTDIAGAYAVGNDVGLDLRTGTDNVGWPGSSGRNVISGNSTAGLYIRGDTVRSNYIGTNASGTSALGNGTGVSGFGTIGGNSGSGLGNVISGNFGNGISTSPGTLIQGNRIGTDAGGLLPLGNGLSGIRAYSSFTTVGGTVAGTGNVISGNAGHGIDLQASTCHVEGNLIGTAADGVTPLGNGADGIHVGFINEVSGSVIGGSPAGRNIVAFNGGDGIAAEPTSSAGAFLRNSVYANQGLGIDLGLDGVTPNDWADADGGANGLQNYPELDSAVSGFSETVVEGSLISTASTTYTVELYSSSTCDPASGFGEGETFVGTAQVSTDSSGLGSFSTTLPVAVAPGRFLTATATDPLNNTSEFSKCIVVSGGAHLSYEASSLADQCGSGGPGSSDSIVDPGETAMLQVLARNDGTEPATNVSATLISTTPGITILDKAGSFGSMGTGSYAWSDEFAFAVGAGVPCGTAIHFTLLFVADQGSWSDSFNVPAGAGGTAATTVYASTDVPVPIQDLATVASQIPIADSSLIQDLQVMVTLSHTYDGDLQLRLLPPSASPILLSANNGGAGDDYTETTFDDAAALSITSGAPPYFGSFTPQQPLGTLAGLPAAGTWTLQIQDTSLQDVGTLHAWSLSLTTASSATCHACTVPLPGEVPDLSWTSGSTTTLQWLAAPDASWYQLYRGTPAGLPALLNTMTDSCERFLGTGLTSGPTLAQTPPPGSFFWYLAVAANTAGSGPAGYATSGPEALNPTGECP